MACLITREMCWRVSDQEQPVYSIGVVERTVGIPVIALSTGRIGDRESRTLRVLKLRGSPAASGAHAYRISPGGIDVFPRLADPVDVDDYALSATRISSGIAALDEILADGYWPGASTQCAGPSGSGKTLMGLHFIFNGAQAGDPGVIASCRRTPCSSSGSSAGGWTLQQPAVELMYRSSVDVYIDEWVYDLLETVERVGARRVPNDSLSDLQFAAPDAIRSSASPTFPTTSFSSNMCATAAPSAAR
jgi:circadian clock protein KaiC